MRTVPPIAGRPPPATCHQRIHITNKAPHATPLAVGLCDIRIKAGRGGRQSWIPLNEVVIYSKTGRQLRNSTIQAALTTQQGATNWPVLAARCFDGDADTGCFDPSAAAENATLVAKIPCSGSGLDELDKLVLVAAV